MKNFTKILSLIVITILFQGYCFPVFAQTTDAGGISKEIQEILVAIINFLSWGWVVPATIAGKLMTNEFVYGKAIHLSNFMRRVWTIMRQLANYAVGILFLYQILKLFFDPKATISGIKDILMNIVKAVLLINISWFAIAAMVDLSIVGIAAVGSLPSQVLSTQWDSIKHKFYVPQEFVIYRDETKKLGYDLTKTGTGSIELKDILPQANNVTGPLFFLGVSVFSMLDMPYMDPKTTTWMSLSLETMVKLFIIALFAIPLVILCVTNMMRIFYLRIWIMLSPIVALDRAFKLGVEGKAEGRAKALFKPEELISLIFQPVVTIAALGLCLILIIGIHQVVLGGSAEALGDIQKILCLTVDSAKDSTIGCEGISFTKIVGGGFGGMTLHILLALLASFLLWMIVKLSFSFSSIVKGVSEGMYNFAEGALGAIPIPGTGGIGVNAAMDTAGKYKDAQQRKLEKRIGGGSNEAVERLLDDVSEFTGTPRPTRALNSDQKSEFTSSLKSKDPKAPLLKLQSIVKDSPKEFNQVKDAVGGWLGLDTTKKWFQQSSQSGLKVTDAMLADGTIYNHPQFQGFMDSLLDGNTIENAIKTGSATTKVIKDFSNKVYPKK